MRDRAYWLAALGAWRQRPFAGPAWKREGMEAAAMDFISRHGDAAGRNGWQAAHLFHERGLAVRWWSFETAPPLIRFAPKQMFYVVGYADTPDDGTGVPIGLHAERNGSARLVVGQKLTALKGRLLAA